MSMDMMDVVGTPKTAKLIRFNPIIEDSADVGSERSFEVARFKNILPSAAAPPGEEEFLLGRLRDGRLQVVVPIQVATVRKAANFIAEATGLNEFGFGTNQSEAIADLQRAIAELYFSLKADQHRLGPDLQKVWKTLNVSINPRAV